MIKDTTFYKIATVDGKSVALLVEGFTDGEYNYCKNGLGFIAVSKKLGFIVGEGKTKRDCLDFTDRNRGIIKEVEEKYSWYEPIFQDLIKKSDNVLHKSLNIVPRELPKQKRNWKKVLRLV